MSDLQNQPPPEFNFDNPNGCVSYRRMSCQLCKEQFVIDPTDTRLNCKDEEGDGSRKDTIATYVKGHNLNFTIPDDCSLLKFPVCNGCEVKMLQYGVQLLDQEQKEALQRLQLDIAKAMMTPGYQAPGVAMPLVNGLYKMVMENVLSGELQLSDEDRAYLVSNFKPSEM